MAWKKLGMVFECAKNKQSWVKSHAMIPTPLVLEDRVRVYYSSRDTQGQSRITYVDFSCNDPTQIIDIYDEPVLPLGKLGTFDDSGTLCTSAIKHNNRIYLYYTGYNIRLKVPYSNSGGVAISEDNGKNFYRLYDAPILDRDLNEPYFSFSPTVIFHNNIFRMWYSSCTEWVLVDGKPESVYNIRYCESEDGIIWKKSYCDCFEKGHLHEASTRPSIIVEGNDYKMWFCYRDCEAFRDGKGSYRIGYAESDNPKVWSRTDTKAGIELSEFGWDSTMQAYPAVFELNNRKYMYYNGNGFGIDGFGCAVWEDETRN